MHGFITLSDATSYDKSLSFFFFLFLWPGIGSWDESDPDEKTLRELRANYNKEKQKEEAQKLRRKELEGWS